MIRRIFICAGTFGAFLLAGCGGGGGSSSLPSSSNVSAGSASVASHVLTADYLGGYSGSRTVTAGQAAPILSWAEVEIADADNVSSAGMKTLVYVDPWRQASSDPLYTSDDSTFSHDCGGVRIPIAESATTTQFLMNPASSTLQSLLNSWEGREQSTGHVDAFFFDDTDTVSGLASLGCNVSQSDWDTASAAIVNASRSAVVFNGFGMSSDSQNLVTSSNVKGAMLEQCYGSDSQPTPPYTTGSQWIANENLEIAAQQAGKLFFCYNNNSTADGASSTAVRAYIYASFLLTYSSTAVLWENFATPSGLHVFPETELVPTNPSNNAPASVSDLESPTGVYVREYGSCYIASKSVGPCAALVNPDQSAHGIPSLHQSYGHTMALSGEGILDGGGVSVSGPAAPSQIPAQTGLVLFK